VHFLVSLGHHADHVADVGLAAAPDSEIWRYARERGATIITKDEDFLSLRALRSDGPAIVWIRLGNTTKNTLLRLVFAALPQILSALESGEAVVEVTGA
jgi:predicted nuclease of predicted toxin-antitoxin system